MLIEKDPRLKRNETWGGSWAAQMRQERTLVPNDIPSHIYLPGLDGLRALAAFAVLIYHAWPAALPGGFLGVDVFFTLSGFLITALLLKDLSQFGTIRLKRFWLRRWRRLFPAVASVVVVTSLLAAFISRDLIARLPSHIAGAITFSYNWVLIIQGHSYFDQMSPKLLTNMWTLSVEQQFYILWPLIVLILWRCHRWIRPWIALFLAGGSAYIMAQLSQGLEAGSRAYMGTDSHAFGLMIGAALALALGNPLHGHQRVYGSRIRTLVGVCGFAALAGLLACFACIDAQDQHAYPGWMLVSTMCTAFIIFSMTMPPSFQKGYSAASALSALLDFSILRWLGVRSYGIYLWHWPLMVIWWYLYPEAHVALSAAVISAVSVLAAALSYRWVENPMRHHGIFSTLRKWFGVEKGLAKGVTAKNTVTAKQRIRWWRFIFASALAISLAAGLASALVMAPRYSQIEKALQAGRSDTAASEKTSPTSEQDSEQSQNKKASETQKKQAQPVLKPEAQVAGENITILGDSVIQAISAQANTTWPGVLVDGQVSRSYYAITPLIQQYAAQGQLRHFVVVGAANNGALPPEVIDEWLNLIGPDRALILITGHGNGRTPWIADSNNAIAAAQQAHPEQVVVADWFAQSEQHPEWLYTDLTHPNEVGIPNFITLLQGSLEQAATLPNAYSNPE